AWVDGAPHEVVQFDATGRQVTQFGDWTGGWELGKFHWMLGGVAVSEDGLTAYTVEVGNNRIQVWTRASRTAAFGDPRAFGGTPENNADREGYCDYAGWLGKFAAPYDVGLDR